MNPAQKNLRFTAVFSLSLLALIFLCHGLSLKAQFMIDDFSYIDPVQMSSIYKEFQDFFLKPNNHHYNPFDILLNVALFKIFQSPNFLYGINLLLFYSNNILLFILVKKITQDKNIAAVTAILFAVHPVNAEMLSHITLNSVLISGGLLQGSLISFWMSVSSLKNIKKWFSLSIFLFILGLLFLETSLLFPAYLGLLCLLTPKNKRLKTFQRTFPFWGIAILYFILWIFMASANGQWNDKIHHLNISFLSYTATLSFLLKWLIENLFFPGNLVFIKNSQLISESLWLWNSGLILALGLLVFLFWKWRASTKSFALGWFLFGFAFMLPASLVHAYSMGMVIEPHWFYFSSMGFFMLLALILNDLRKHIKLTLYITLLMSLAFYWGITSYRHHVIAKTEIGYLEYWLKNSPGNLLPALMLGNLYGTYKSWPIPEDLIEQMDLQSDFFIKTGLLFQATRLLEKLIISAPLNSKRRFWEQQLTALYIKTNATSLATSQLIKFEQQKLPRENYLILAKDLERLGLREKAIGILDQGLRFYPDDPDLIFFKIITLVNENRFHEAKAILNSNPNDPRFITISNEIEKIEKNSKSPLPPTN